MKAWGWLKNNSEQLTSIAALVGIAAGLVFVPGVVSRWFKADVLVQVAHDDVPMPSDLSDWVRSQQLDKRHQ